MKGGGSADPGGGFGGAFRLAAPPDLRVVDQEPEQPPGARERLMGLLRGLGFHAGEWPPISPRKTCRGGVSL
jgi:hypothetical protein